VPRVRPIVLALTIGLALATAPTAAADQAPTVTLLGPPNGANVILDGKHTATFTWRIDFPQPQSSDTTIVFTLSSDPSFVGPHYTETRTCAAATPACFTATMLQGGGWITAATGAAPKSGMVALYWRVSVTWRAGQTPAMSTAGTLLGTGASSTPDVLRPQVRVQATTVKRGTRAKIPFHLADDSGTVAVVARLLYHSTTLLTVKNTFTTVDWGIPFVFWFDVPRQVPAGRYTACVRATDPSGNSAQSCAAVKIR
jgi:hypothetical protein